MVTPTCYPPADMRRYGSRVANFPPYSDRRITTYSSHPEPRNSLSEKENVEEQAPQRKRIAVACGRCRKRKIRCSGDTGNGGPCVNCKNAGYEPCQFLRVASQETMMKNDPFTYNLDASRQYQARGSTVVPPLPTIPQYPDGLQVPSSDPVTYRQNSASFAYNNAKSYYPVANWAHGIAEDQPIAYPIYGPSYHALQEPEYSMSYRIGPGAPSKPSSLYVDTEPNYGFSSGSSTTNLVHRPAVGDSSFAFQNVAPGITTSANVNDRLLPMPVGRTLSSSGASSYRNDSTASTYSKESQSSASAPSPTNSGSDVGPSYTHYDSSLSSYSSTSLAAPLTRSGDLYSTVGSSDGIYSTSDSLRPSASVPDMQYRYTDTTIRKDSTSTAGTITLNGSAYMPQSHHHHASYMLPSDVSGSTTDATITDGHHKTSGPLRT